MLKITYIFSTLFFGVFQICNAQIKEEIIKQLINAYPNFIDRYEDGYVFLQDGTRLLFDDGKNKSFIETLDNSDIEDMFACPYSKDISIPSYLYDAGRSRNEALFKKMYGNSASQVAKELVNVDWFGQKILFTTVNNANVHLEAVRDEIARYPYLKKYVLKASTFYWRKVRGANRQSAHSYGIAIDINVTYSDYWLWKSHGNNDELAIIQYVNRIPLEVVDIFERHGFIWGGRWYHFDTMHFEFRPELNPISE